jgi:hypothetical protein
LDDVDVCVGGGCVNIYDSENISRWVEFEDPSSKEYVDFYKLGDLEDFGFYEVMIFEDRLVQMYNHQTNVGPTVV